MVDKKSYTRWKARRNMDWWEFIEPHLSAVALQKVALSSYIGQQALAEVATLSQSFHVRVDGRERSSPLSDSDGLKTYSWPVDTSICLPNGLDWIGQRVELLSLSHLKFNHADPCSDSLVLQPHIDPYMQSCIEKSLSQFVLVTSHDSRLHTQYSSACYPRLKRIHLVGVCGVSCLPPTLGLDLQCVTFASKECFLRSMDNVQDAVSLDSLDLFMHLQHYKTRAKWSHFALDNTCEIPSIHSFTKNHTIQDVVLDHFPCLEHVYNLRMYLPSHTLLVQDVSTCLSKVRQLHLHVTHFQTYQQPLPSLRYLDWTERRAHIGSLAFAVRAKYVFIHTDITAKTVPSSRQQELFDLEGFRSDAVFTIYRRYIHRLHVRHHQEQTFQLVNCCFNRLSSLDGIPASHVTFFND